MKYGIWDFKEMKGDGYFGSVIRNKMLFKDLLRDISCDKIAL